MKRRTVADRLRAVACTLLEQHRCASPCGSANCTATAALVLQTFILAAETLGFGCGPISVIRNHADAVAAILQLPEKVFPVAGLCIGYPAAAGHISMRLPPRGHVAQKSL